MISIGIHDWEIGIIGQDGNDVLGQMNLLHIKIHKQFDSGISTDIANRVEWTHRFELIRDIILYVMAKEDKIFYLNHCHVTNCPDTFIRIKMREYLISHLPVMMIIKD